MNLAFWYEGTNAELTLKRMEIGEDNIQGVDYVYTLQGWLKGINSVTSITTDESGQDNNNVFSKDVFGMVLGYHDDDFNRAGSKYNPATTSLISSQTGGLTNLYNGNISSWTLKKDSVNGSIYNDRKGFKYRYDQLNRLKSEDYSYNSGSSWQASATMDSRFTYDANGNIDSLKRWGYNGSSQQMDNMKFNYYPGTNRLKYVADAVPDGTFTIDADDQSTYSTNGNYTYTATGERAKDIKNGIDAITWTVYGKVKSIKQTDGDSLAFRYDAAGNRVMKYWKKAGLSPVISYYVRDASGNDMGIYESANSGHNYTYTLKENPIFGSEMLGVYKPNKLIKTDNNFCFTGAVYYSSMDMGHANGLYGRSLGKKEYFMKDHLDNIRTVFTDRKKSDGYAEVKSYNNYYAYGMLGTGTNMNYTPNEVRFGYGEHEKDDEVYNITGASLNMNDRFLDGLIPVSLSTDRKEAQYTSQSPYTMFNGNPIYFNDPTGESGEATINKQSKTITVEQHLVFYGGKAETKLSNKIATGIASQWNAAHGKVMVDGVQYKVNYKVTYETVSEADATKMAGANGADAKNNFIRVEDGVGSSKTEGGGNAAWYNTDDDLSGSTTPAHEIGHGLGIIDHTESGQTADDRPDIMTARKTIVNPRWSKEGASNEIDPNLRQVTGGNVNATFKGVKFDKNGKANLGRATNTIFNKDGKRPKNNGTK